MRSPARDSSPESYASLPLRRARSSVSSSSSSTGAVATGLSGMNGADRMNGAGDLRSLDREMRNPALLAARGQASEAAAVGQTARLGDVAEVAIHPEEVRAFRRLDGLSGINMDIYAQAGHSPVDISRAVREALEEIRQDPALGGVETMIFFDQGETILATLGDLKNTGVYGGLLGVIVLFLFLRRLQTTLVAALCIPLTILATCGILFLRGEELNCIVLLGLVLGVGMLIDNAVVIVEAIELHARRGEPIEQAIARGSREVGLATIASTISSVIVFLPLMFGDPADEATYLGPLTRPEQVAVLEAQIDDAIAKGASVRVGGHRVDRPGSWFEPTVLTDVDASMLVMRDESFGPIIGIQVVGDDDEAVAAMNDTEYGLTAGVYTADADRAQGLLARLDAGSAYWNCCDRVSPRLPWSGRGHSGVGLTLSTHGIRAFTQPKALHLRSA